MDEMRGTECEGGHACFFLMLASARPPYGRSKKRHCVPSIWQRFQDVYKRHVCGGGAIVIYNHSIIEVLLIGLERVKVLGGG